jgi:epsilon-lactone hydrolase
MTRDASLARHDPAASRLGYSGLECHLSRLFNVTFVHVEYRLSPEHRLPADAVHDALTVYRSLLARHLSPSRLMFMGDSAGGGLSLLTIQALVSRRMPVPVGVVVFSPWTDLSASGQSYARNQHTDVVLRPSQVNWWVKHIIDTGSTHLSLDDATVSPLFGSFHGFPPMYITVGTAELLQDDARRVSQKAETANVNVTLEEGQHLMHVYPIFYPYYAEARHALNNIDRWVRHVFESTRGRN